VIGEERQPRRFTYPEGYHPEKHMDGMFGVYEASRPR
jgi:hypothetical protein